MIINPRSVLQFATGDRKGLLCQVLAVEGDTLQCLCRDFDGRTHFFNASAGDDFRVIGNAALGPKPKEPGPEPPPPLNPMELLEPLPPEIKVEPLLPKAPPPLPPERRYVPQKAKPAPRPPVPKVPHLFTVQNALGDEVVVPINVRVDDKPERCKGAAFMRAAKMIPNEKPFTLVSVAPKQ